MTPARHGATALSAPRPVFYVSDGTGITAETVGHSLLTQFAGTQFTTHRISFVDTTERAQEAAGRIRASGEANGVRPIVVSSCVDPALTAVIGESGALMLDVFAPFIEPLERELGESRQARVGQAHGMVDFDSYHRRIDAINFALTHDDGMSINYDDADLILVAVSRAGKTPTCVYLALHHGVSAANYPLTEEDLEHDRLPPRLRAHRNKLFALTIDPVRLQQIRQERRPNSRYARLETCRREVAAAEAMFKAERIPVLSTTHTSIEEIASKVMSTLGIQRGMF
jgi:[pyruvate, water dikinase]-phosphate phosphotransferase / [pyruvate, water dikinase] kinase